VRLYSQFFPSAEVQARANLEDALVQLYTHILTFLVHALRVLAKNTAMRSFNSFWRPEEILAFANVCQEIEDRVAIEMHNLERLLNAEARTDITQSLGNLLTELKAIKTMRSIIENQNMYMEKVWKLKADDLRSEILFWVSDIPYVDHHQHAASQRTTGTGIWLVHRDVYYEWENSLISRNSLIT
jgi:hypothetical protein